MFDLLKNALNETNQDLTNLKKISAING